jgi:DMSO/TMAO reductase YedYZ molybdopterin-dependent catalytic subunit
LEGSMNHLRIRLIILAALALAFSACGSKRVAAQDAKGPVTLAPVEVRNYEGADLSSVNDFRENSINGVQHVDPATYRLEIAGLVATPLSLTLDQAIARTRYRKIVTLRCVEGWDATILWEGVKVKDLLAAAGYDPKASTVIFTAYDGYTTSHPLAYLADNDILLAYRMNGIPIPDERGYPFVLVAEDKWGYKWIKWVTKIEVSNDAAYRGYWEMNGYSNDGSLQGPIFGP